MQGTVDTSKISRASIGSLKFSASSCLVFCKQTTVAASVSGCKDLEYEHWEVPYILNSSAGVKQHLQLSCLFPYAQTPAGLD